MDLNKRARFESATRFHYGAEFTGLAQPTANGRDQSLCRGDHESGVGITIVGEFACAVNKRPALEGCGDLQSSDAEDATAWGDARCRRRRRSENERLLVQVRTRQAASQQTNGSEKNGPHDIISEN